MNKFLLYLFFWLLLPFLGISQSLWIDTVRTAQNIPDTIDYGSNISYNVRVNYFGATPYTGPIYIVAGVDSSNGLQSVDTVGFTNVTNLIDSVTISVSDTFDNARAYRKGDNVVVIWPVTINLSIVDTFKTDVHVRDNSVGLKEEELINRIELYPNPFKDYINIHLKQKQFAINEICIYDINGKEIVNSANNQRINVSNYSSGIYFIRILFSDKRYLTYKLIKD